MPCVVSILEDELFHHLEVEIRQKQLWQFCLSRYKQFNLITPQCLLQWHIYAINHIYSINNIRNSGFNFFKCLLALCCTASGSVIFLETVTQTLKLNLWIRHCERVLLLDSDQKRPIRACLMQCTLTLTFGPISCLMQCQRNVLSMQMILG